MNRSRIVTAATSIVAVIQHPVLLYICAIAGLFVLTTLIGTAALSRKKYRRDAARNVLELALGFVHRDRTR
ncbi:MAG: hypothetical protein ACRDTA_01610 [Pseudonocardiaceae bacterium]